MDGWNDSPKEPTFKRSIQDNLKKKPQIIQIREKGQDQTKSPPIFPVKESKLKIYAHRGPLLGMLYGCSNQFIIFAELLKCLQQVDLGSSYIEKYLFSKKILS